MNEEKERKMTATPQVASEAIEKAPRRKGFFHSVKEEMGKVTWTSKEELKSCTKIVLGSIFTLGFGVYFIDVFLRASLQGIANLAKVITG